MAAWVEWLHLVACGCLCSVVAYGCLFRGEGCLDAGASTPRAQISQKAIFAARNIERERRCERGVRKRRRGMTLVCGNGKTEIQSKHRRRTGRSMCVVRVCCMCVPVCVCVSLSVCVRQCVCVCDDMYMLMPHVSCRVLLILVLVLVLVFV